MKLPLDGILQNKGAKMDPRTWKVVPMLNDSTKFKVVDDNNPPINVAHMFNSEASAQQFINHHIWIKDHPCPDGQVHDMETGICNTVQQTETEGFYGNQFIRHLKSSGKSAGCVEIQSKGEPSNNPIFGPANGLIYYEVGIPAEIVGMKGNGDNNSDEITLIFKENHGDHKNKGKFNMKVMLKYNGKNSNNNAKYTGEVEIGCEDDHNKDSNPKKLEGVTYQNKDVIKKYEAKINNPIKAKGYYQDTKDGGIRYKLEIQDPETNDWKKILDHVDYGDDNHDIKNYRGASAYCSAIRIDGHAKGFVKKDGDKQAEDEVTNKLRNLFFKRITTQKSEEQSNLLSKIGYGSIKVEEIQSDNSDLHDGIDDPLSFGKK